METAEFNTKYRLVRYDKQQTNFIFKKGDLIRESESAHFFIDYLISPGVNFDKYYFEISKEEPLGFLKVLRVERKAKRRINWDYWIGKLLFNKF